MNTSGGPAGVGHGGHEETPLDPIQEGWKIFRGPQDYTHAVLPFYMEGETSNASVGRIRNADYSWRMTSPYQCFTGTAVTDANTNPIKTDWVITSGGASSPVINQASYYAYMSSMYKYYSVMSCRYKITIENLGHEKFMVHKMFHNNTIPPTAASNHDMRLWNGVESKVCQPIGRFGDNREIIHNESFGFNQDHDSMASNEDQEEANATDALWQFQNPLGSSIITFSGEYRPGDHNREVHLDDAVSIYTATSQNPTLLEALLIRIKPYDNATATTADKDSNFSRPLSYRIQADIEYLCEFKELPDRLKWPLNHQPMIVSVSDSLL
nr:MAG: capsid protein [Parvo-like hybrid virus UC4]